MVTFISDKDKKFAFVFTFDQCTITLSELNVQNSCLWAKRPVNSAQLEIVIKALTCHTLMRHFEICVSVAVAESRETQQGTSPATDQ